MTGSGRETPGWAKRVKTLSRADREGSGRSARNCWTVSRTKRDEEPENESSKEGCGVDNVGHR